MKNSRQHSSIVAEKELQKAEQREYHVVQHNDLIQQSTFNLNHQGNSLTLTEWKILLYVISRIKPDDKTLEPQTFDIKSFCDVCGISTECGDKYTFLKKAITKLASRVMWLTTDTTETTVRWIDRAMMNRGSGQIQIKLDEMLEPYLVSLHNNYTQFPLHNIVRMKSKYGLVLYQLLRSYAYQSRFISFDINDLKEHLDATNYTSFTNFKTKVLAPALSDINTYSELEATVEFEKTGKTYTTVIFEVRDLSKSSKLEDRAEAQSRYNNAERELDPNQMSFFESLM